jgi:chromosome segregation ATPase
LLRETVAALHGELERRTSEVASLRAAVGDARGDLEARSETQGQLEATLGELSVELRRLMEVAEEQRTELDEHRTRGAETAEQLAELTRARTELAELRVALDAREDEVRHAREQAAAAQSQAQQHALQITALREELAASHVAREGALSEVAGLQGEMSRIGAELAVTRERVSSESGDLGQAGRLLAEAKALADQLRRERDG